MNKTISLIRKFMKLIMLSVVSLLGLAVALYFLDVAYHSFEVIILAKDLPTYDNYDIPAFYFFTFSIVLAVLVKKVMKRKSKRIVGTK